MSIVYFAVDRQIFSEHKQIVHTAWNTIRHPHVLFVGVTGSGKTYAAKLLLGKTVKYVPNTSLTVCDFKASGDFAFLKGSTRFYEFANCIEGIDSFYNQFQERQEGNPSRSLNLIFIDELASILTFADKREVDEIRKKMAILLAMGRSFNCHVVLSSQRADAENFFRGSRDNLGMIVAFGQISRESAQMLGFNRDEMLPCYEPGQGHVLRDGVDLQPIIVPRIKNIKLLEETIRRAVE